MYPTSKPFLIRFLAIVLLSGLGFFLTAGTLQAGEEENTALLDRSAKAFTAVVKKAGPAVVYVRVEKSLGSVRQGAVPGGFPRGFFDDPLFERFFGPQFRQPGSPYHNNRKPRQYKQRGAGSGFIISKDGYILTNNHVVEDADKITVILDDKREFTAKVVGTDPQSDVALIKIDADNLPTLPLGDSDALEVGEWVIAIGSPFELSQTVTVGVVSAKGRNRMGINDYENFIQTDAAINPGNSGGPLLNIRGEAVGINTAIFSRSGGYMGIGFAIPINMAKNIEQQLKKDGKVTRGWLGVIIQDITRELAESFELDSTKGVLISGVSDGSPADDAGLKQGDVILSLDGKEIKGVDQLRNTVALIAPGTRVKLTLARDGREKTVSVKIGEQPSGFGSLASSSRSGKSPLGKMGLTVQELTPELADQFGYKENQGVLISEVDPDSPAARVGIRPGQLIEEVNKIRVRNLKDLQKAMKKSKKKVLLRIRAGEFSQYVVLQAE